ncbi:redoxin domain-containing protein [Halobaculum roseum]|uniref:Redoxin domain-containing protein n=1 Tax=Halobaculum roseum TaxID=2175149 RepID=A0ABD5MJA6_9EURY|nr:redoxin domain-containing protein [Halobaculum roseum]QZY02298.1 redoxin domain-containing protein [Halobaculum roseum]
MLTTGDLAPDFSIVGVVRAERDEFSLSETTDAGNHVVLFFYPADFSPVCTPEMCAIRDADFFEATPNVVPWAISGDSTYAHRTFADAYDLGFPLLSDTDHSVAAAYDVKYEEWEGHRGMVKRGVFLIDPDRRVRYAWRSDDAYVKPDLWPLRQALDEAIRGGSVAGDLDEAVSVPDYDTDELERIE